MRCIDCNNYQYKYETHYCNANPKKPKRIMCGDELKDVFCDKIDEPIEISDYDKNCCYLILIYNPSFGDISNEPRYYFEDYTEFNPYILKEISYKESLKNEKYSYTRYPNGQYYYNYSQTITIPQEYFVSSDRQVVCIADFGKCPQKSEILTKSFIKGSNTKSKTLQTKIISFICFIRYGKIIFIIYIVCIITRYNLLSRRSDDKVSFVIIRFVF